jgi:hypothetical protein
MLSRVDLFYANILGVCGHVLIAAVFQMLTKLKKSCRFRCVLRK